MLLTIKNIEYKDSPIIENPKDPINNTVHITTYNLFTLNLVSVM